MKLFRHSPLLLVILLNIGFIESARAIAISFSPLAQNVLLGDSASVDVILENPAGNLVGAYDFFVNYDASILSLNNVVQGSALGGPADTLYQTATTPGQVNVAEVSFLFDLSGLQDASSSFTLFTLVFDTLAVGSSALLPEENILGFAGGFVGDELGFGIALDSVNAGSITVVDLPVVDVGEPAALLYFALGLLGLRRLQRR